MRSLFVYSVPGLFIELKVKEKGEEEGEAIRLVTVKMLPAGTQETLPPQVVKVKAGPVSEFLQLEGKVIIIYPSLGRVSPGVTVKV